MRVSYNSLRTYLTCPLSYKYCYVDGEKLERTTRQTEVGRRVHEYAESILRNGAITYDSVEDPYLNRIAAELTSIFNTKVEKYAIEEMIDINVEGIRVVGKPDVVTFHADGAIRVYDFKSFGLSPEKNYLQGLVYHVAVKEKYGRCDDVTFISPRGSKTYKYEDQECLGVLRKICDQIMSDTEFRAKPGEHCLYCAYREKCAFVNSNDIIRDYLVAKEQYVLKKDAVKALLNDGPIEVNGVFVEYKNGNIVEHTQNEGEVVR